MQLCHIPGGVSSSAYTIAVDPADVAGHLAHGDSLGSCPIDCKGIPYGKAVIDLCGVCGGDSSSCKDCKGVPNGSSKIDACGVCDGDGSTCKGCDGLPNSGKVIDACGICGGDNSSCKDCKGVPNGGAKIDECGVCDGNSTTCLDCKGVPNGTAKIDGCGVCGGDNSTCILCQGTVDACGVCNGPSGCLDCAGIPNGGTVIDCCGVCGGDGSTCIDKCKFYDVKREKLRVRKNMNSLLRSVKKYSKIEGKCAKSGNKSQSRIALAERLAGLSIESINSFADTVKFCDTQWCSKSSYISVLSSTKTNLKKLYRLSQQSQYGARKACGITSKGTGDSPARNAFNSSRGSLSKLPNAACVN